MKSCQLFTKICVSCGCEASCEMHLHQLN